MGAHAVMPQRPHWRQPQLSTPAAAAILLAACLVVPWAIFAWLVSLAIG
jgi:hypothetical protein